MHCHRHARLGEDPSNAGDHLATRGIVGALRRSEDLAVIVRPDFEEDDPGVEAERAALLSAEIDSATACIKLLGCQGAQGSIHDERHGEAHAAPRNDRE